MSKKDFILLTVKQRPVIIDSRDKDSNKKEYLFYYKEGKEKWIDYDRSIVLYVPEYIVNCNQYDKFLKTLDY